MSSVQRSMLGWRRKKKLVADSVNAVIFAEEDYIRGQDCIRRRVHHRHAQELRIRQEDRDVDGKGHRLGVEADQARRTSRHQDLRKGAVLPLRDGKDKKTRQITLPALLRFSPCSFSRICSR